MIRGMTKLIAIFIVAWACVSAQEANPVAAGESWEYCTVDAGLASLNRDGVYEAKVRVCYAQDQGCREEVVTMSERRKQESYSESEAAAVGSRATAKALAQLGKDRWELVSVTERSVDSFWIRSRTYFFKRRAR